MLFYNGEAVFYNQSQKAMLALLLQHPRKDGTKTMKKLSRLLALLLCLALCLCLAACGGTAPAESDAPDADEAAAAPEAESEAESEVPADDYKIFVYGTDANSTTFDPASDLQTNSGAALIRAVGETLWTVDLDGNMKYKLAESVEYSAESLNIVLREGVKFSNGNDLTVSDVLFTFKHIAAQPRTAAMYACMDLENAEIVSDYEIHIPMNNYDAALIDLLGNASSLILDEEVAGVEGYAFDWLIGSGPYMLKGDGITDKSGWEEAVQYILVRNPEYWGEAPYYDEIQIRFYSQESTRFADLQAGNLDAAYLTESTYINNLANGTVPETSLVSVKENTIDVFTLAVVVNDASGEPGEPGAFNDINVRKAFAHCLDIPTIVESLGEGVYTPATNVVTESSWVYEDLGGYEYDPELAAQYLAEAGYSVDNPLNITMYCENTSWNAAVAEAAQSYCAAIGINLDLSGIADFATILPHLLAREVQISISYPSNGSGNDPANLLQQMSPGSDNSMLQTRDEHLAELFTQAQQETDRETREALYKEFLQGVHDGYYVIPIDIRTKNYGVKDVHTSFASALDVANQLDPTLLTD